MSSMLERRYRAMNVSERYWWKVVALCFAGWVLMYADRTILNPVMGKIAEQFNLNNTQLGALNSIFFLTYAIMQIPGLLLQNTPFGVQCAPFYILLTHRKPGHDPHWFEKNLFRQSTRLIRNRR